MNAAVGASYAALPAAVAFIDTRAGVALAVGALIPAAAGFVPSRRARLRVPVIGLVASASMLVGGVLAGIPVIAVAAIALLGPAGALLAARAPIGAIGMNLGLPLVGVGLSYSDPATALAASALIAGGSLVAVLISLLWPERPPARRSSRPPAGGPRLTIAYGVRLGAAGATAAAIGFVADLEHVGWATAAALFVMRPAAEMQRLRSTGRILAVAGGALVAVALVQTDPPTAGYAIAIVAVLAGVAGTRASRWYLTPAFSTFLVFLLLLADAPQDSGWRLWERVSETALGIGIAYIIGLGGPAVARRTRRAGGGAG